MKKRIILASLAVVAASQSVMAQAATFDPTTATDKLTSGVTTAVAIVGSLVALAAGVMVWKKVAGFFRKSG